MKDEIQYQLKKKIDLSKKASDYFSLFDKIVSEEKFNHTFPEAEKEVIIQEVFDYLLKKEQKKYHNNESKQSRSRSRHSSKL
jgi:hypothetical protein